MRPSRAPIVAALLALTASVAPDRARAEAPSQADTLVDRAVELRRAGDDQGALTLLRQAYGFGQTPRTAGQLGLCEQALGRWADAELYLTEALKFERDPWVKKNRRTLEDSLSIVKSHIARLEIQGEPEGADVWVNGARVGSLPLPAPVRVAAGEVEIELRVPGFVRETKTMRLEPGQYQLVVLRARQETPEPAPAKAAAPPPVVTPPPAPAPTAPSSTTTVVVNVADPARHGEGPRTTPTRLALKWAAWGLGAAAVGVGVYGAIGNHNDASAFRQKCALRHDGMAVLISTGMPDGGCENQRSSYESKTKIAVFGFASAGVLAAAGFVLWLTEPAGATRETAALSCAPTLTAGGAALGCGLRF